MAARWPAKFYVYELSFHTGDCAYIGKGSGHRLKYQKRAFLLEGHEVARFWREADAYKFEKALIAERFPVLNRSPGGNGSWVRKPQERHHRFKWEIEMARIGTRAYAARFLIGYMGHLMNSEWNSKMKAVAYG